MKRKKVLIVSRSFYPIIAPRSFRASELAKELSRQGHSVTILTHKKKSFNYSEFSQKHELQIKDFVFDKWIALKTDNLLKKGIRLMMSYLFEFPDIQLAFYLNKQLKKESNYDLIISIAIPYSIHWGVALAKKNNPHLTKTWIADCGDPFTGDKERRFTPPFYFRYIEKWFCKQPDYITVPIEEAIEAYPFICQKKIKVIPQGFSFEDVKFANSTIKRDQIVFGYAGTFNKGKREPKLFLDYLSELDGLDFKFVVYTKATAIVEPYKKDLGNKLVIKDYVPRLQLLNELSNMNFLVNIENKYDVQKPSKLIDYALTGRPILSVSSSKLNKKVIDEFLNGNFENKVTIKNLDQYNIKNVVQKFLDLAKE